jgi:hypothetical protein
MAKDTAIVHPYRFQPGKHPPGRSIVVAVGVADGDG